MIGDFGIENGISKSFQFRQSVFFVDPYQAARARDIRRQNSCQSPLYVIAAQGAPPGLGEIEYLHSRIVGRCPAMLMSETGSKPEVDRLERHVRSTLNSRRRPTAPACLSRANIGQSDDPVRSQVSRLSPLRINLIQP